MSISTKSRPQPGHKKIQGGHHRHSKNYLKTYWPYIPVFVVLALGVLVNHIWHASTSTSLTAYSDYGVIESSIGVIALAIFLLRHAFAWHKVLVRGEDFVSHHPYLDICLVTLAVSGFVLSNHVI